MKSWKLVEPKDAIGRELKRVRLVAEAQLQSAPDERVPLSTIDQFLCRNWYRLDDRVCDRLFRITETRERRQYERDANRARWENSLMTRGI